ncbi:MAG: carboxypeptidase regulatory-like domain-containing protein, partial [Gammaproteobacteria bacterium]|nr:carboxypeptidase regulatory-like domain-containing protein [Gammaproteobacteria bacterium]
MNVDPVDDCTFWYVNEYLPTSSSTGWVLRIGAFKFDECGGNTGTLTGQVTEAGMLEAPGDPIAGATIEASLSPTQTWSATSNASGYYTMTLITGTYDVAYSAFGFLPETVSNVDIFSGTTTIVDVGMAPASSYTVDGIVTDANTGWPLYANIDIDGYPGDPIWTDPVSGYYSITLPEGITYTFNVNAWVPGYLP